MSDLVLPPASKSIGLSTLDGRKPQSLLAAAQHNRRHPDGRGWQRKSDPNAIHRNECLLGPETCEGVVQLHAEMMTAVGYTPKRKDFTQAHEILFTTPPDLKVDHRAYLAWCLEWTQANLGHDIVLSADTHFDEGKDGKAPHLHILVAPISDGKWVGNTLTSGKTWPVVQAKFGRDLELKFGLKLMPQLKGKALTDAATAVNQSLTALLARHIPPDVLQALLKLTRRKPSGLVGPLGLAPRAAGDGGAAFRRIALSTGKGAKKERTSNPYGIEPNAYGFEIDQEKAIPLFCNGIAAEAPPQPTTPTLAPHARHCCDDADQTLSDVPNADGEIAAPPRPAPTPLPAPDKPIEAGATFFALPPLTCALRPVPLPTSATNNPVQPEAPFVELTTRQRDCDQAPDRYDLTSGDYIPTKPPAPRLLRQAADGWVMAALATRSQASAARHH